ncbi:hypothetical protein MLD38_007557 [Melastoma candidum]|nr:hypothetical protein MLD38_007557 [Melastoma candidum]
MQSVDEALDQVSNGPLCDWKGLKMHVNFPSYYKFLQSSICPPKLVTYFTVERLESSCCICAAFLRAHRIARRQLHDFIGDSDIASFVINESEGEGEEARKFLEDVRVTFPQVLRVVKTRQVTFSVLTEIIEYVKNLKKVGLLEEKELIHLEDAVQTDLKKLLRNPPLIKIPKISDLISVHPFIGALPSIVGEQLKGSAKEMMKLQGVTLYREGFKPNGVWLISNGVVKWASTTIRSKHSLHPTFTHGSTLGLFEVLNGKPFICDMITDSVVVCCFVESEKILSILRSDPSVEDFLWQESAIILAKLLLPQVFEKMAMQELRALVSERSEMTVYIRGETIEVPQHCVGFLLEGFIKPQGAQDDLITSPSALLPSREKSFQQTSDASGIGNSGFSSCQGSWYHAESRARVIIFDLAALETDNVLQRRSSSFLPHSVEHPLRIRSREHSGLMSWPESFCHENQQKQSQGKNNHLDDNLSIRAMQLSFYGSMVDVRPQKKSFHQIKYQQKTPRGISYPQVPSRRGRQLLSVRSEGAAAAGGDGREIENFSDIVPPVKMLPTETTGKQHPDYSSDESAAEDIIVRVDSPSRLSFFQSH